MRELTQFSTGEWFRLSPLVGRFKQLRNDITQKSFLAKRPKALEDFLSDATRLGGKNVLQIIAFEQADVLDFSIKMIKRHVDDAAVLIFDNSRKASARIEIERVCRAQNVPYLTLPSNPSRHPNRSHGMAMTWVWHNVIQIIRPAISGFIDHDLIPLEKIEIGKLLNDRPFYGVPMVGKWGWSLWAGCCFYNFAAVSQMPFNFLNDFSRGLDTGGRNWNCLYKNYDRTKLKFADWQLFDAMDTFTGGSRQIEVIDKQWIHIGRVGHDDGHRRHSDFYGQMIKAIEAGANWQQLQAAMGGVQPTSKDVIVQKKWTRWRKHHFDESAN